MYSRPDGAELRHPNVWHDCELRAMPVPVKHYENFEHLPNELAAHRRGQIALIIHLVFVGERPIAKTL